jgi:hypothetical protein
MLKKGAARRHRGQNVHLFCCFDHSYDLLSLIFATNPGRTEIRRFRKISLCK